MAGIDRNASARRSLEGIDTTKLPPPLPRSRIGAGSVWPAELGRRVLRELAEAGPPVLCSELVGQQGLFDGTGSHDMFIYRAGDLCVKTSARRRYSDVELARAALVRMARTKKALGRFVGGRTTLCLEGDGTGNVWLWTVASWVPTLRSLMTAAATRRDEDELGEVLAAFARSALDALGLAATKSIVLDAHPSNFARDVDGRVIYIDDDVAVGATNPAIGHALLRRVDEYAVFPRAVRRYLDALEEGLRGFTVQRLAELDVPAALATAIVTTELARASRRELLAIATRVDGSGPALRARPRGREA